MSEQQRPWARTATFNAHDVQRLLCEFDAQLGERVQLQLKSIRIEVAPVLHEGVQPNGGDSAVPPGANIRGPSIAVQPATELAQRTGVQSTTLLDDLHVPVVVHATILTRVENPDR
jgi:hypothetical protein